MFGIGMGHLGDRKVAITPYQQEDKLHGGGSSYERNWMRWGLLDQIKNSMRLFFMGQFDGLFKTTHPNSPFQ